MFVRFLEWRGIVNSCFCVLCVVNCFCVVDLVQTGDSYGPSPVSGGAPSPPLMMEGPGRPPSAPVGRRCEPLGESCLFGRFSLTTNPSNHPPFHPSFPQTDSAVLFHSMTLSAVLVRILLFINLLGSAFLLSPPRFYSFFVFHSTIT